MWKWTWLSASPSVLLLPEQTETFLQPTLAHPERSRSGWKCIPGGRGEGRQTSTALGYRVPVCSLLCSQAPKPPKDKESRRQGGHGCMTSDCEGWRLAVSHAGGLCAKFQLSVSCQLDKHTEVLIIWTVICSPEL